MKNIRCYNMRKNISILAKTIIVTNLKHGFILIKNTLHSRKLTALILTIAKSLSISKSL